MRAFTDNITLERAMQSKHRGRGIIPASFSLPKSHFCYGCASYGGVCFAVCHRNLWRSISVVGKKNIPKELKL